jgi:presequence protease
LSFQILAHALIGTPASPLKKALTDSGLGEDLAGIGLESELREMIFSTGLKGTRARHAKRSKADLRHPAKTRHRRHRPRHHRRIDQHHRIRPARKQHRRFPRGIALMLRALTTWLYDDDAFKLLAFEAPLAELKNRLATDSRYFEKMIQTHLLDNVHRTSHPPQTRPRTWLSASKQEETSGWILPERP